MNRNSAWILWLIVLVAIFVAIGWALREFFMLWGGLLTAIVVTLWAKHKHPEIPFLAFFRFRGGRVLLPMLGWFVGAGAQLAFRWAGDLRLSLAAACIAVLCSFSLFQIFRGKIMTSLFKLVPTEEQAALAAQLDDLDAATKGAEGQAMDLSGRDAGTVTQAIERTVIGQDAIVEAVVQTTFRRVKLARKNKPVATFLFVGATGAGKTELAKALAAELCADRLIRIDCNELSESHSVQTLIGPPRGYVGSDKGGRLTRELGRLGTGVLLLDEIEKADPAVLKVLMNLLDEARLTDASNSITYSARGFVIVLTSNAAANEIAQVAQAEADSALRETKVRDALRDAGFLPEILARLDAIFPFSPLASRDVARIVERFLLKFAGDVGVALESCDSALLLDLVTRSKKTAAYGIREVVRSVENAVVDGLLAIKDAGHNRAAIHVRDGQVHVELAGGDHAAAPHS